MIITLVSRARCYLCGYWISDLAFPSVRVNKRSIRQFPGNYMCWRERSCPECGTEEPLGSWCLATPYRPDEKSRAEIDAYREKRWPELKDAARNETA